MKAGGKLVITGLKKFASKDAVDTFRTTVIGSSAGILDIGAASVSGSSVTDGKIDYSKVPQGVTSDEFKNAVVVDVNSGDSLAGEFKAAAMKKPANANDTNKELTVNNTLVLTGVTSDGFVVTGYGKSGAAVAADVNVNGKTFTIGSAEGETVGKLGAVKLGAGTVNVLGSDKAAYTLGAIISSSGEGTVNVAAGSVTTGAIGTSDDDLGVLSVANGKLVVDSADEEGTVAGSFIKKVAIGANGSAEFDMVTVGADGLTVASTGAIKSAKADLREGTASINGTAEFGKLQARTVNVGSAKYAGTLIVGNLLAGTIFGDPDFAEGQTTMAIADGSKIAAGESAATSKIVAGRATLAALGVDTEEGLNDAIDLIEANGVTEYVKDDATSIVYVDGTNGAWAGKVTAGNYTTDPSLDNVNISATSLVFVDQATVEDGAALFALDTTMDGDLYVANANATKTFKITEGTLSGNFDEDNIEVSSDRILGAELDEGEVSVYVKEGDELGLLANAVTIDTITDYYAQGLNNGSAWFEGMMTRVEGGLSDKEVVTALNDMAAVGATAGMAAVTMDALSAFNDTVAQRTSILNRTEGTTVWADVNGGKYEANRLMNGAGYSSDIYAGVIGVDTTFACGAKAGAAITVGTGDTDSKNTTAQTSMDSDFFGISVYTSKTFGEVANVAVDLGYMQGSNDVTVKSVVPGKFSADSDAFTLGIRGELLAKVGDFNLVPHAGLRWTRLSVDDFQAGYTADLDTLNVFQLPVGVTVSGEFEAAGWTVAPAFDLSFVPAFGDKEQAMTLGIAGANVKTTDLAVQVIDSNPVQATLGVDAVNGAWAFGLNYKLGVGTDSRMNNSFNANVRYTF